MKRRKALFYTGLCLGSSLLDPTFVPRGTIRTDGPPDKSEWKLVFEDQFASGSLDTDSWEIGWGWGRQTSISNAQMSPDNVSIRDGKLRLTGNHDGSKVETGGINSRRKITFGPGSYLEARIKCADREGFHNSFWAKPNSGAWPPEIDVVEQWHSERTEDPTRTSNHHIHYSTSTKPADRSTYKDVGVKYELGDDITENFHVYGVEWRSDKVVHYVDRTPVKEWTDETLLRALQRGAPFYMMVNMNINSVGTADTSEQWTETMVVDWVRLWDHVDKDNERYLWANSTGEKPARFAFRTSGGNIRLETEDPAVKYWVSADRTTAGGTAPHSSSLPGFFFEGKITDFNYEGPLELYIDNTPQDPDKLVDGSTPGPPLVGW